MIVILCTGTVYHTVLGYFGNKNPGHRFLSFAELATIVASSQPASELLYQFHKSTILESSC